MVSMMKTIVRIEQETTHGYTHEYPCYTDVFYGYKFARNGSGGNLEGFVEKVVKNTDKYPCVFE